MSLQQPSSSPCLCVRHCALELLTQRETVMPLQSSEARGDRAEFALQGAQVFFFLVATRWRSVARSDRLRGRRFLVRQRHVAALELSLMVIPSGGLGNHLLSLCRTERAVSILLV